MNYTGAKIFNVVFSSFFLLFGSFLLLAMYFGDEFHFVPFVVGLGFALGGAAMMRQKHKELSKFQKQTYAAYKASHPEHVSPDGVRCSSCDSKRTQVRALMRHRYHREHFCADCGKTLYYSPEQQG